MFRRKAWIWFALAIACAIGAGVMVFFTLEQQALAVQQMSAQSVQPVPTEVPTIALPVAAHDLTAGTTLTENDIALKDFPLELVPSSAISTTEMLDGQVLVEPIAQGDIFRQRALLSGGSGAMSQQIEPGKTLLALPIIDLMGQSGLIRDGDHVDLLLTINIAEAGSDEEQLTTGYTVQHAEIFRVMAPPPTDENPNPKPTGLLLLLTPEDAVMVKFVKDSGGTIDLLLRSPLDQEPFDAPSVNEQELIRILEPATTGGR